MIDILVVLMMITSVGVFGLRKHQKSILLYSVQTLLLVGVFLVLANIYEISSLKAWAVVAFFTKVLFVPFVLLKLRKKVGVINEVEPVGGFFIAPLIAVAFALALSMLLYRVFMEFSLLKDELALFASSFIFLMGIFGFIFRNSFIKHILAYCLFENGIHLSLALMAYDSHELVEIGILTDAIFAVLIMSVLAVKFYESFGNLDVSKATNLRG